MLFITQMLGGVFYLLNKIFLFFGERAEKSNKQRLKSMAWVVYLIGLPAWIIIFADKHNWIALAVEVSGAPSMVLGLINAQRSATKKILWLDRTAIFTVYLGIGTSTLGLVFSVFEFNGITALTQVMEIGIAVGFLVGTYLLANKRPTGYLWFLLMSVSATVMFYWQNQIALTIMQVLSVGFTADAYRSTKKQEGNESEN